MGGGGVILVTLETLPMDGLINRILEGNPKKELLWDLWVAINFRAFQLVEVGLLLPSSAAAAIYLLKTLQNFKSALLPFLFHQFVRLAHACDFLARCTMFNILLKRVLGGLDATAHGS